MSPSEPHHPLLRTETWHRTHEPRPANPSPTPWNPRGKVNAEQRDRYVDLSQCDYVVDLGRGPSSTAATDAAAGAGTAPWRRLEPWHGPPAECAAAEDAAPATGACVASGGAGWELVHSEPFLDAAATPPLARTLLVPAALGGEKRTVPYEIFKRVWPA
jgi:hypothetical protein